MFARTRYKDDDVGAGGAGEMVVRSSEVGTDEVRGEGCNTIRGSLLVGGGGHR